MFGKISLLGFYMFVFEESKDHLRPPVSVILAVIVLLQGSVGYLEFFVGLEQLNHMGKLCFSRVLACLCLSSYSNSSCFCMNSFDDEDAIERKALIGSEVGEMVRIRDIVHGNQTLAFQLKPKMVVLRVSMHCNGCARKVEKHISKMNGVTSFEVDLESKKVVVVGDIVPSEVLESVSKVKFAELWSPCQLISTESIVSES